MLFKIQELRNCLRTSQALESLCDLSKLVAVELNTSCPNIQDTSPPSYDFPSLRPLLDVLASAFDADQTLTVGLKLPPYVHQAQFEQVVCVLSSYTRNSLSANPFSYIACTNTLGSSLIFAHECATDVHPPPRNLFALPTPLGGLGGDLLHPLALGNVYTFAQLIYNHPDPAFKKIAIIGVGGVTSFAAAQRMRDAGATVVACATFLGQYGIQAFKNLV